MIYEIVFVYLNSEFSQKSLQSQQNWLPLIFRIVGFLFSTRTNVWKRNVELAGTTERWFTESAKCKSQNEIVLKITRLFFWDGCVNLTKEQAQIHNSWKEIGNVLNCLPVAFVHPNVEQVVSFESYED